MTSVNFFISYIQNAIRNSMCLSSSFTSCSMHTYRLAVASWWYADDWILAFVGRCIRILNRRFSHFQLLAGYLPGTPTPIFVSKLCFHWRRFFHAFPSFYCVFQPPFYSRDLGVMYDKILHDPVPFRGKSRSDAAVDIMEKVCNLFVLIDEE